MPINHIEVETSINEDRAGWAGAALGAFIQQTGCDEGIDSLQDLIADLGHWAEIEGYDFIDIVARAIGTWLAERDDPMGMAASRPVTILTGRGAA